MTRGSVVCSSSWDACWIFTAGEFSNWASIATGLRLRALALFAPRSVPVLDALSKTHGCSVINASSNTHPQAGTVTWALCDGRPTRFCLNLCKNLGASQILSSQPLRSAVGTGPLPAWHTVHLDIHHAQVGGTTDKTVTSISLGTPCNLLPVALPSPP